MRPKTSYLFRRGIMSLPEGSSLCRHMILVMKMHLILICFAREMTQRVAGLERDRV